MIAFIVFFLIWIRITILYAAELEHEKEEIIKQKVELETIVEDLQNDKVDLKNTNLKLQEEVQSLEKDKQELLDAKAKKEKLAAEAKKEKSVAKAKKEKPVAEAKKEEKRVAASPTRGNGNRTNTFIATAYDLSFASCGKEPSHPQYGITASGVSLKGKSLSDKYIAVDPKVIKLGSSVHIEFFEPYQHLTGNYTAVDTGGAIKGNKVDIFFGSGDVNQAARNFGRRQVKITY